MVHTVKIISNYVVTSNTHILYSNIALKINMNRNDELEAILSKNKRMSDRLLLSLSAEYSTSSSTLFKGPVEIKNISSGGLSCIIHENLEKGNELSIKIRLKKNEKPILLKGVCAWSKTHTAPDASQESSKNNNGETPTYEIGVKFHSMSPVYRQRFINFFCDHLLS